MLKNLSIMWKLWLLIGVSSLFGVMAIVAATVLLEHTTDTAVDHLSHAMVEEHKETIKDIVETAVSTWEVGLHDFTTAEKKLEYIHNMNEPIRFFENHSGYIFVYEKGGMARSVPVKVELEGKSLWGAKDADGMYFIRELEEAAANGGGFVEYHFQKPGSDEALPKLSFAMNIPGTNFWAGTGIYIDDVEEEAALTRKEIHGQMREAGLVILGVLVAFFAFFVFPLAVYISRSILNPLKEISDVADNLSKGCINRTVEHHSRDEIGQTAESFRRLADVLRKRSQLALAIAEGDLTQDVIVSCDQDLLGVAIKKMSTSLNTLLQRISSASKKVDNSSSEISHTAQALSQGAVNNAANLQEITASLTEVSGQTQTNATNATNANELALEAKASAQHGSSSVVKMVEAMDEINESSQAITKVITAIDDIAFKTNLLALNAAVEAARAGKHGKGFAVVAEEVRTLAGQSAKAARESAGLLEDSQEKVERGSKIAEETSSGLVEILNNSGQVAALVGEIADASNQQAASITEINDGLRQIDNVTQQNSAHAEETSAGTTELMTQAGELRGLLTRFRFREAGFEGEHTPEAVPTAGAMADAVSEYAEMETESWPV